MNNQVINIKASTVPPQGIYEKAREMFGADFRAGVVFTVGDTIHAMRFQIPDDLMVHERTHVLQQINYPGGPQAWWERYFEDIYFRFNQEMEAYNNQYKFICQKYKDRNTRAKEMHDLIRAINLLYKFDSLKLSKERIIKELTKGIN